MKHLVSLALAALVAAPLTASAEDGDWAVFDSQKAMESTSHFQAAKSALEKEVKARESKFEAQQAELKKEVEALEAQKAVASKSALAEKEQALVEKEQALRQLFYRSQQELSMFDQKLKQQLFMRLEAAVKKVATDGNHAFVIDKAKVLFHRKRIDITDEVIAVYEKQFGDKPLDLEMVQLGRGGPQGGGR